MVYIFDMGNVVIKGIEVLDKTAEFLHLDTTEFFKDYQSYLYPMMDGIVSTDTYYRHLERKFGISVPGNPFGEPFFDPYFNEPMVAIIKRLKANGHRILCGSNTVQEHWDVITKRHLDQFFDKSYLSHLIGLSKPSPAFFLHILKEEGIAPEDAFFVDDRKENVDTATKLGLQTLWYPKTFEDSLLPRAFGFAD